METILPMKWLLTGCLTILIVGLVAGVFVAYWGYRAYKEHVSPYVKKVETQVNTIKREINIKATMDSPKVIGISRHIMRYRLSGVLKGDSAVSLKDLQVAVVESRTRDSHLTLLLASAPSLAKAPPEVQDFISSELNTFMQAQSFHSEKESKTSERLCGQKVTVEIQEGKLSEENKRSVPAANYTTRLNRKGKEIFAVVQAAGPSSRAAAREVFSTLSCP